MRSMSGCHTLHAYMWIHTCTLDDDNDLFHVLIQAQLLNVQT